jgi:hypothetical protein
MVGLPESLTRKVVFRVRFFVSEEQGSFVEPIRKIGKKVRFNKEDVR